MSSRVAGRHYVRNNWMTLVGGSTERRKQKDATPVQIWTGVGYEAFQLSHARVTIMRVWILDVGRAALNRKSMDANCRSREQQSSRLFSYGCTNPDTRGIYTIPLLLIHDKHKKNIYIRNYHSFKGCSFLMIRYTSLRCPSAKYRRVTYSDANSFCLTFIDAGNEKCLIIVYP